MNYLLDTTTLLSFANRVKGHEAIARKLAGRPAGEVLMSAVSLAELEHAALTSRKPDENLAALAELVGMIRCEAWPAQAARHFGELKAALEHAELETRPYDLMIAAHACVLGATLVTAEPEAFAGMPGLKLANWLKV